MAKRCLRVEESTQIPQKTCKCIRFEKVQGEWVKRKRSRLDKALGQYFKISCICTDGKISVIINLPLFPTVLSSNICCFCPVGLSLL